MKPYDIGDLVEVKLGVGNGIDQKPTYYTVYVPPGTQHIIDEIINKVARKKAEEMANDYITRAIQRGLEKLLK